MTSETSSISIWPKKDCQSWSKYALQYDLYWFVIFIIVCSIILFKDRFQVHKKCTTSCTSSCEFDDAHFRAVLKTQKSFFERFNGLSQRKYNRKIKISKSWVTEASFQIDANIIALSANQIGPKSDQSESELVSSFLKTILRNMLNLTKQFVKIQNQVYAQRHGCPDGQKTGPNRTTDRTITDRGPDNHAQREAFRHHFSCHLI